MQQRASSCKIITPLTQLFMKQNGCRPCTCTVSAQAAIRYLQLHMETARKLPLVPSLVLPPGCSGYSSSIRSCDAPVAVSLCARAAR
jgi:hypothetical protein